MTLNFRMKMSIAVDAEQFEIGITTWIKTQLSTINITKIALKGVLYYHITAIKLDVCNNVEIGRIQNRDSFLTHPSWTVGQKRKNICKAPWEVLQNFSFGKE